MPVRVRIQDFQSIKDATIEIVGLTVVTGPNNSGKTAAVRAIRGVFTNAPAGPLVRHGAAQLTVTLTFEDGTEIIWEKGWEKPGQKGKTVNKYTVNGTALSTVGRGVPPEVADLGVREIQASSDTVWPQIADQFDGTLFLLNRPGSSVAEALSDVEKVGKLSLALKKSEKDRRSASSELKVRRKDLGGAREEADRFAGLDDVSTKVQAISKDPVLKSYGDLGTAKAFQVRLVGARAEAQKLEGFDPDVVPSSERGSHLEEERGALKEARSLAARLTSARTEAQKLEGFDQVSMPDPARVRKLQEALQTTNSLAERHRAAQSERDLLQGMAPPSLPDATRATRVKEAVTLISSLRDQREKAVALVGALQEALDKSTQDATSAGVMVTAALGERGLCPTCNTVHEGGQHAQDRP